MTLREEHTSFYRWSKRGNTPHIKSRHNPKERVSFFGGLCLSDKRQILHLSNKQDTKEMIEWLELVKVKYKIEIKQSITPHLKNLEQVNRDKDVEEREYKGLILICLDGAGFHRSKELKEYLKDNYGIFEFSDFPHIHLI